ncbi:MAG TPA: class I SAM-dependent methyltransferase, partial [Cyclobacteriaceae bacterium]
MELTTAIHLIEGGVDKKLTAQTWADLGAGNGLFTKAIASLLNQQSEIYAIDKDLVSLRQIPDELNQVSIKKRTKDFSKEEINEGPFDGILMANSLHYVQNQSSLLTKLIPLLKSNGRMILIEYDMDKSNTWVPYPISYAAIIKLAKSAGFELVT